jgi:hypothetical protein
MPYFLNEIFNQYQVLTAILNELDFYLSNFGKL